MPAGLRNSCLCVELILFLGAHLGRGSSDSTFALSEPLHFRALFWPYSYSLFPFRVMYFQDANLFIHASVRLECMMVHKLTWLLSGAGSLLRSLPRWGERGSSRRAGFSLHAKDASPAPGSSARGAETVPFTFLQTRNLTTAKMSEAINYISTH